MLNDSIKGVILAGGKGSRIMPLSKTIPKPLLQINNKPIMEYQIEALRREGITDIMIVVGHLGNQIKQTFGSGSKYGVKITYIESEATVTGSLLKLEENLNQKIFALFLADIFMSDIKLNQSIQKLGKKQADGIVVATKAKHFDEIKRNFSIATTKAGQIVQVVEKPKQPINLIKGLGVYLFNWHFFDAIKKTTVSDLRGEVELTDSIQTLINNKKKVFCDVWDIWDFNITYPQDLIACEEKLKVKPIRAH